MAQEKNIGLQTTLWRKLQPHYLYRLSLFTLFLALSTEVYRKKIFSWLAACDGKDPTPGFYYKNFTEYGEPSAYPSMDKCAATVYLSEDSD